MYRLYPLTARYPAGLTPSAFRLLDRVRRARLVQARREERARFGQLDVQAGAVIGREHRVFYIAKLGEAVYVLHAFEKRSRKTPRQDLEIARDRFRLLLMARGEQGG